MSDKDIRILINGHEYHCDKPSRVFAMAMETMSVHVEYMSDDNIKNSLKTIYEMVYNKETGLGCRRHATMDEFIVKLDEPYMRGRRLLSAFFDLLLAKEGLTVNK